MMNSMSEPRRWWIYQNEEFGSTHVCDFNQRGFVPNSFSIAVIEAEPVLARIKQLEAQLKEANEVAEFYGDEKNWMTTRKDELHEARMTIAQDAESFGQYSEHGLASTLLLIGGKRARAYLHKWKGEK